MSHATLETDPVDKRFLITSLSIFVLWIAGSFVVHGSLLYADYAALPNLFRPPADAQRYFPFMLVAHAILASAFVWIYSRGVEDKPWLLQGMRYGAAVALLTIVPTYLIYYAVQPMPGATVARQIVFDGVLVVALGAAVAFAYRERPRVMKISRG
jgi:drug/metabolite transporter (DMT)-like permease